MATKYGGGQEKDRRVRHAKRIASQTHPEGPCPSGKGGMMYRAGESARSCLRWTIERASSAISHGKNKRFATRAFHLPGRGKRALTFAQDH